MTAPHGLPRESYEIPPGTFDSPKELSETSTDEQREFLFEVDEIMKMVKAELVSATMRFGSFASAHEGYGVILEEVDELWDEIKGNKDPEAYQRMRKEARQVAAMACRFLLDVTPNNQGKEK